MRLFCLLTLFLFVSCDTFTQFLEGDRYHQKIDSKTGSSKFSILFSHNINGETHPCGCRHFPLGGLPQVAGALHKVRQEEAALYVDTGDTFFPSPHAPETVKKSLTFTANYLIQSMDELGLDYFVPGDQDFALGESFLAEVSQRVRFKFLVANLWPQSKIKHRKWVRLKVAEKDLYLIGIVQPSLYSNVKFRDPVQALKEVYTEMQQAGFKAHPHEVVVLLSHAGIDQDRQWVRQFPWIHWVIGAHSQSFTQRPETEGKSQLVQVLSRNHYLGRLQLPLATKAVTSRFETLEIRDKLKDQLKPNPWVVSLEKYKNQLQSIQKDEQQAQIQFSSPNDVTSEWPDAQKCLTCHAPQAQKWRQTAHALAYYTLIQSKAQYNDQCITCHSLGHKQKGGFSKAQEIVQFEDPQKSKLYAKALNQAFGKLSSIRQLSSKKKLALAKKWQSLDEKFNVKRNLGGVQCLHCHSKHPDHPFESNEQKIPFNSVALEGQCLKCHTQDQSPEWYKNGKLQAKIFQKRLHQVACPARIE